MPLLDQQSRLRELGRIRIGATVPTDNGKTRPAKLNAFRLTSMSQHFIDAAAAVYGGEPKVWEGAPGDGRQWEVFTTATELEILLQPGEVLEQHHELWSGGGCQRRCDGVTERLSMRACLCAAALGFDTRDTTLDLGEIAKARAEKGAVEQGKWCKPTTRLRVILGRLPGIGVWRLETHGWYAAGELAGVASLLEAAAMRGRALPAVLRLEARERRTPGQPTRKFAVPVIDVLATAGKVLEALGTVVDPELGVGARPALAAAPERGRSFAARVPLGGVAPALPAAAGFEGLSEPGHGESAVLPAEVAGREALPSLAEDGLPALPSEPLLLPGDGLPAPSVAAPSSSGALGSRSSTGARGDWRGSPCTREQVVKVKAIYGEYGIAESEQHAVLSRFYGVGSHNDLSRGQLSDLIESLERDGGVQRFKAAVAKALAEANA